jgi:hypothetical protein
MKKNLLSYQMTVEEKDALKQDIDSLAQKVSAFAINLSPEDRKRLSIMGNKSVAFVSQALQYAREYPEYIPPYLDVAEFEKDYQFSVDLRELLKVAEPVLEKLSDTFLLAGVEAFTQARSFYDSVKAAAKSDAPGTDTLVAELKKRYKRKPAAKNGQEDPQETQVKK